MNKHRRRLLLAAVAAPFAAPLIGSLLTGCDRSADATALKPADIEPGTTCDLDGMLLGDYPGPKGQILYAGATAPVFCCDTVELFSLLLKPEQVRPVAAAFVQDMAQADWEQPRGHWFDAKTGFYVVGSKRQGSMGPTFASFAGQAAANEFAGRHGGKVLRFAEVKPEMADLSGGAQQDTRM
jgi:copper chaperone NosL